MGKREIKLRKETLSNLTNLNIREMEELKGGKEARQEVATSPIFTITVTNTSASYTVTASVTIPL
jgi:hypothetical protein